MELDSLFMDGLVHGRVRSAVVLVNIDIATGAITQSPVIHSDLENGNSATINQIDGQYLYKIRKGSNNHVISLDLTTGELLFELIFKVDSQDNLIDIEYDNKKQKLYSKHWDAMITNVHDNVIGDIELYPNPVYDHLIIKNLPSEGQPYYLDIYDLSGKTVVNKLKIKNEVIDLPEIASGQYFISIYNDQGTFKKDKTLIKR